MLHVVGSCCTLGPDALLARPCAASPAMCLLPTSSLLPTCLALEALSPPCPSALQQEEFINGSALRLECNCRGDLALRHRDCVMKWVQVKGSNVSAGPAPGLGPGVFLDSNLLIQGAAGAICTQRAGQALQSLPPVVAGGLEAPPAAAPARHRWRALSRALLPSPAPQVCELCKAEIRNIPAPPPRPAEADLPALDEAYFNGRWGVGVGGRPADARLLRTFEATSGSTRCHCPGILDTCQACLAWAPPCRRLSLPCLLRPPPHPRPSADPNHIHDFMPSSQDLVFDCIRVCWVAMIVSILFFEMSLGAALWTGMLAGLAYSIMVRLMYRQHFFAMRRLAEQQAAARREQEAASGGEAPVAAPAGAPPVVVAV